MNLQTRNSSYCFLLRRIRNRIHAMKTCIVLSALPGSGKSTWAKEYQASHPNTFILSSDDLREELYGYATNFQHEKEFWGIFMDRLKGFASKGDDVTAIVDATNLLNSFRILYNKETPEYDRHILVVFDIPYEVALKQNAYRIGERCVPTPVMERFQKEFEPLSKEVIDLYDEVIVIRKYTPKK